MSWDDQSEHMKHWRTAKTNLERLKKLRKNIDTTVISIRSKLAHHDDEGEEAYDARNPWIITDMSAGEPELLQQVLDATIARNEYLVKFWLDCVRRDHQATKEFLEQLDAQTPAIKVAK